MLGVNLRRPSLRVGRAQLRCGFPIRPLPETTTPFHNARTVGLSTGWRRRRLTREHTRGVNRSKGSLPCHGEYLTTQRDCPARLPQMPQLRPWDGTSLLPVLGRVLLLDDTLSHPRQD